jgi:hypothetical protein
MRSTYLIMKIMAVIVTTIQTTMPSPQFMFSVMDLFCGTLALNILSV